MSVHGDIILNFSIISPWSVLIEGKTISDTGSFVASYFEFHHYIGRLGFISILAFILLPCA